MKDPREEKTNPIMGFDVNVTYTLVKKTSVTSDNYEVCEDLFGTRYEDTSRIDWKDAYNEYHYSITHLLKELKEYAKKELRMLPSNSVRAREVQMIMRECDGWEVEEEHFEEA